MKIESKAMHEGNLGNCYTKCAYMCFIPHALTRGFYDDRFCIGWKPLNKCEVFCPKLGPAGFDKIEEIDDDYRLITNLLNKRLGYSISTNMSLCDCFIYRENTKIWSYQQDIILQKYSNYFASHD